VRKVYFPLKYKFILLFSVLLGLGLTLYVGFALQLFGQDKSAYIYESSLNASKKVSQYLDIYLAAKESSIRSAFQSFRQQGAKNNLDVKDQLQKLIGGDTDFLSITIQEAGVQQFAYSEGEQAPDPQIFESLLQKPFPAESEREQTAVNSSEIVEGITALSLFFHLSPKVIVRLQLDMKNLISYLGEESFYQFILFKNSGEPILISKGNFFNQSNLTTLPLEKILDFQNKAGVQELELPFGTFLLGHDYSKIYPISVWALMSKEVAYQGQKFLLDRSITFGVFILALAVVMSLLFARSLTRPLEELLRLALEYAKGNFDLKSKVQSRDEIGALTDSFHQMGDEIKHYLGQMQEKARLESEVAIAQTVQETFFPQEMLTFGEFELASRYFPASECGGDFWGEFKRDNKWIFMLSDATGHGVGAALMTASAHSTLMNIEKYSLERPEILQSPGKILEFINHVALATKGKMQMTAFVGILDLDSMELKYSNASHNPPLLIKTPKAPGEFSKADFVPLMEGKGPRLGHKQDAIFKDASIKFEEGLVLYTDGIIEIPNLEGKQFGQRRFINALCDGQNTGPLDLVNKVFVELDQFRQGVAIPDDLTLLILKRSNKNSQAPSLSDQAAIGKIDRLINVYTALSLLDEDRSDGISKDKLDLLCKRFDYKINWVDDISQASIVMADVQAFEQSPDDSALKNFKRENIIFIGEQEKEVLWQEIIVKHKGLHIVGKNSPWVNQEMAGIIFQIEQNSSFSIQQYLGDNGYIKELNINSTHQINREIQTGLASLPLENFFDGLPDYVLTLSNELITNAFYYGIPGANPQEGKYQNNDRKLGVVLADGEKINVKLGINDHFLMISVKDFRGSLGKELVSSCIQRGLAERRHQVEQKGKGAGLGLFMAFSLSNGLMIKTIPGVETEIMAVIDINKRFKNYKLRNVSFHLFESSKFI